MPCRLTQPETTSTHIFKYRSPDITKFRKETYDSIIDWLTQQDTHPYLVRTIIAIVSETPHHFRYSTPSHWIPIYQRIYIFTRHQIMQGFLPKGITNLQQGYYEHKGSQRTGSKWGGNCAINLSQPRIHYGIKGIQ